MDNRICLFTSLSRSADKVRAWMQRYQNPNGYYYRLTGSRLSLSLPPSPSLSLPLPPSLSLSFGANGRHDSLSGLSPVSLWSLESPSLFLLHIISLSRQILGSYNVKVHLP